MKKEGGCEWYQLMVLIFLYISANFLLFFKGPRPFKLQKTLFSGLTTENAPWLNQVTYAAKNTIAGGSQFKSHRYRGVAFRCRLLYWEDCFKIEIMKKTFPGSADSGRAPANIFKIAVVPFYNRRWYRWVPPLQSFKIKKCGLILWVLTGIGTIAGGNFVSFPLAICIKKSAKRRVYSVSRIFLLQLLAMKYFFSMYGFYWTKIFINIHCTEYDYHIFVEFSL